MAAAARIGDLHTCPMTEGGNAHAGGPIGPLGGSPNVKIGGSPAAREGDACVCIGSPDAIKKGSTSVNINGKPAARLNDLTNHGGMITAGCTNVNIGG
jgi:uncharacterized Zn-binding protein involved in type VI secretion